MSKKKEETLVFTCVPERQVFSSEDFKIYGARVDFNKYKDIKRNSYGGISLVGNYHTLSTGTQYEVTAVEKADKKFGTQYEVLNIKRDRPNDPESTRKFLKEVITEKQAEILLEVYPDIVDKIIKGDLSDIDLEKTKGIKGKTFKKIKDKVIENFALVDVVGVYGGYGLSLGKLKTIYDKFGSVARLEQAIAHKPYETLCSVSGIGFKTADKIILSFPPHLVNGKSIQEVMESDSRVKSCIDYILGENEKEGHTKMDLIALRGQVKGYMPKVIDKFPKIIKQGEQSGHLHICRKNSTIAFKKTYLTEKGIMNKLKDLLSQGCTLGVDFSHYTHTPDGNAMTNQQIQALKYLVNYKVSMLAGLSGAGKTSTVKAIISMLDDNNLSYMLLAPTGKASEVLGRYCNRPASTIHRGLRYNPKKGFMKNQSNPIEANVVIVDEFSMVDVFLAKSLLDAISLGTTVLFIQDPAQIPSVSCGNVSADILASGIVPTTLLDKVFRYGEGGLYNVATKIRNGLKYISKDDVGERKVVNFGDNKDYSLCMLPNEQIVPSIVRLFTKLVKEDEIPVEDIVVMSHHNKGGYGCVEINKAIQKAVNPYEDKPIYIKHGDSCYSEGDRVMQVVNNYKAKAYDGKQVDLDDKDDEDGKVSVFNGNTGTVKYVLDKKTMVVDFGNNNLILYKSDNMGELVLGYAINMFKMQGSASRFTMVLTPDAHIHFINRNLLYTAITRTEEKCYHFSSLKCINSSLRKSANLSRNTHLKELILENIDKVEAEEYLVD